MYNAGMLKKHRERRRHLRDMAFKTHKHYLRAWGWNLTHYADEGVAFVFQAGVDPDWDAPPFTDELPVLIDGSASQQIAINSNRELADPWFQGSLEPDDPGIPSRDTLAPKAPVIKRKVGRPRKPYVMHKPRGPRGPYNKRLPAPINPAPIDPDDLPPYFNRDGDVDFHGRPIRA